MKTALISALLAFTALSAIVPAKAYDASQSAPQIDVPYGDLNLSTPMGAQTVLRRIQVAAAKVCGAHQDHRVVGSPRRYRQCVDMATRNAVARVNAPLVVALHMGGPVNARWTSASR